MVVPLGQVGATQKLEPGLYIKLDRNGNKVFTRVLPEIGELEIKPKVFISPEVVELKQGLYTYLDKNGNTVLIRDLSPSK